jgi:hypothetical protein
VRQDLRLDRVSVLGQRGGAEEQIPGLRRQTDAALDAAAQVEQT